MALQLLRFRVTPSEIEKDASSVRLAPVTRLDGINWNITGVVNHSGTLHQGHYTAYTYIHTYLLCTNIWQRKRQSRKTKRILRRSYH